MFFIIPKSEIAWASLSIIQSALKILCLQCSEFACANIINSTSVGFRSNTLNLLYKYSISSLLNAKPSSILAFSIADLPKRVTFIIDKKGMIQKIIRNVNVHTHGDDILEMLGIADK